MSPPLPPSGPGNPPSSSRLCEGDRLTRTHGVILVLAWAGWLFDFYNLYLYSVIYSFVGKELGITRGDHGIIMGISLGSTAVGGILFGFLADRYGRKSVLQATILTYCAGALFCGLVSTPLHLALARVITGLGVGGEWATGHALISESFPATKRGRYGALMQTGAPLGVGLAALLGSFLTPILGWRATFVLSASPVLLVPLIRMYVPESELWLQSRRIRAVGSMQRLKELVGRSLGSTTLRAFLLTVLNMSGYWLAFVWLPAYLREERGMSIAKSGLWVLVIVTGELIGYTSFGFVSDRLGRKPSFTIYAGFMAIGLLMITLAWDRIAGEPLLIMLFMAVVGLGTGTWSNFGPFFSELFPTRLRNAAVGSIFNAARGVQFLTPILLERVAREWGLSGGIALAALFSAAAAAWIWTLPETRGRVITAGE